MIRILLTPRNKAYGFNVTNWESKPSDWYDNLLTEDLITRVNEGDVLLYIDSNESAENWCKDHEYEYEFIEPDDDN